MRQAAGRDVVAETCAGRSAKPGYSKGIIIAMADDKSNARPNPVSLGEGEFKHGSQVILTPMAADFNPPSASMNPAASPGPAPASNGSGGSSAASPSSSAPTASD